MNRSESIAKLSAALLKAQKSMSVAKKDAANPFFKSNYADLNAIREAVMPALNESGVAVLQATDDDSLETILLHESGEFISSRIKIVVAKQNDPQAYGSAMSYARRYALQALLCVGAEDDDGNKATSRPEPKAVNSKSKSKPTSQQDEF